jgi:hypothetical protein
MVIPALFALRAADIEQPPDESDKGMVAQLQHASIHATLVL